MEINQKKKSNIKVIIYFSIKFDYKCINYNST